MKMKITKVKNDKTLNLVDLFCGDTFLYQNKVCMVVDRNGHSFCIDVSTGRNINVPNHADLVEIECELIYKVVQKGRLKCFHQHSH